VGKLLIEHFESIGNVLDEIEGPYWK
jgi:hypothetical protein